MGNRKVPKGAVKKMLVRHELKMRRVTFMNKRVWCVQPKDAEGDERANYLPSLWAVWRKYATKEDADDIPH